MTRQLYNAALHECKDAYRMRGVSISAKQQYAELTALRKPIFRLDTRLVALNRECEDAVLHRLDLAMQAFFRRCKRGETPGFPRFRVAARWTQIEFPHGDRALRIVAGRVTVPGIGQVRLRKGREVPEERGRAWIVDKNARWYACFECDRTAQPLPATGKVLGVDRGVHVLAATSESELIRNGPGGRQASAGLSPAMRERSMPRRSKTPTDGLRIGTDPKRIAAVQRLARAKQRETNARLDALHKAAKRIVESADIIAIEELRVRNMVRRAKGTDRATRRQRRSEKRIESGDTRREFWKIGSAHLRKG